LPDPGTPEGRRKLCERIGGRVAKKIERKKMPNGRVIERVKEEVEGGILNWIGTEPKSGGHKKIDGHRAKVAFRESELNWFREEIKKAYGGRAPRVLDPFAGGGAIPLEAMRLGCEATAVDINPVAWFILKCTLEYPQKLAGKTHPLPDFILEDEEFMESFYKAHPHLVGRTKRTKKQQKEAQNDLFESLKQDNCRAPKADLAWHVRAWGRWVLNEARKELAPFYPTYSDFEPLDLKHPKPYEAQEMRLVPLKDDGTPDIDALNDEFSDEYLRDKKNPRWVAKSTVAYLWARTVKCKNCRALVPLLKTLWLCKKDRKRVLLTMKPKPDGSGVEFGIQTNVPSQGGNAAQKREHDKRIGAGTMSSAGAWCPCCQEPGRVIMSMEDIRAESNAGRTGLQMLALVLEGQKTKEYKSPDTSDDELITTIKKRGSDLIDELPKLSISEPFSPRSTRSISAQIYGIRQWGDLFTTRQCYSLKQFGKHIHKANNEIAHDDTPDILRNAIVDNLALALNRLVGFMCVNTRWKTDADSLTDAFSRFSISLLWDFAEANPLGTTAGGFVRCVDRIATACDGLFQSNSTMEACSVVQDSAAEFTVSEKLDLVITDPPYYQAVSYADLSDFFYSWLRGVVPRDIAEFELPLTEKEKEFVQHIRNDRNRQEEKRKYEDQMASAFINIRANLSEQGRFVCVFAHKEPDAWETLVSAIIRAGFVVVGSWPIQTEMPSRQRGTGVAALASSVWLICRPRESTSRTGWDNKVLDEMRSNITERLHAYWDAGIRGPDFVWAATGPALEAYSKHPIVKKANAPGEAMDVGEFLSLVRRMVVDFVVGQVLTGQTEGSDMAAADRMDAPTAYYLLHRHDFGLDEAPSGRPIPLIDRIHRLMHLWRTGDVQKVDEYLDDNGLRRQELFKRLVQSMIELSTTGSEERSLLESLSNHVQAKGGMKDDKQRPIVWKEHP